MAFVKKVWKDRLVQYPNRRKLIDTTTGTEQTVNVQRVEGTVAQVGDAFSAANMNDMETRIDNEFTAVYNTINAAITQVLDTPF